MSLFILNEDRTINENNTGLYKVNEIHENSMIRHVYKFVEGAKCTKIEYSNILVWEDMSDYHPQYYPISLIVISTEKKFTVFFGEKWFAYALNSSKTNYELHSSYSHTGLSSGTSILEHVGPIIEQPEDENEYSSTPSFRGS